LEEVAKKWARHSWSGQGMHDEMVMRAVRETFEEARRRCSQCEGCVEELSALEGE